MQIEVSFDGGDDFWQKRITDSAARASAILSGQEFQDRVRSGPPFDFTDQTPAQIADKLAGTGAVAVKIGFYWNPFTKSIAQEGETGGVRFNTAKQKYDAGSPGNVAHELMHVLGYHHRGNLRAGNENSVPYRIGDWVDAAAA